MPSRSPCRVRRSTDEDEFVRRTAIDRRVTVMAPGPMNQESEDAYWNAFYRDRHADLEAPSSFATHVLSKLGAGALLFELGCGNGRDALFFASKGLRVVACDRSQ